MARLIKGKEALKRAKAPDRAKRAAPNKSLKSFSRPKPAFSARNGDYYVGDCGVLLSSPEFQDLQGRVQLILTSPPYPLNEKKSYGNHTGDVYLAWLASLATTFSQLLTPTGSIVIELGNSWEPERPVQSLLATEALLAFTKAKNANLRLIQQFICYNPSRLPTPAAWVTVNRIRAVDSYTNVWWLSNSDYPKADNKRILRPYSDSMKSLLKRGKYNAGKRPSEHSISDWGFLTDQGGAISHNVLELEQMDPRRELRQPNAFSFSNTSSNDFFHRECKRKGLTAHPARMPVELASFFIQFLTDEGDLVLDPFGGSNTTGYAAALANRKWMAIEAQKEYVPQAKLRFDDPIFQELKKPEKSK